MKIGLGQVRVTMGDKAANVAEIMGAVSAAAKAKCDLVALPECSLVGWLSAAAGKGAEPIPGPFTRKLSAAARRHRMAIVIGIEERENGRLYNSAVLISDKGELLARHRKINELDIGLKVYTRGTDLKVVQYAGRPVALDICADSWRPEITDALYLMGARIIFSPSAWAVEPGGEATNIAWIKETYRARAHDKDVIIIAPNGVGPVTEGPWKGRILQGNSLITGPGGKNLLEGPTNEPGFLTYTIQ